MQVHVTNNGEPIVESAICARCEGDAGRRIKSWMNAQENKDYNGGSRVRFSKIPCSFCGRKK